MSYQNSRFLPSRHFLVTSSKRSSLDRSNPDECAPVVGGATAFLGLPFFFLPGGLLRVSLSTLLRKTFHFRLASHFTPKCKTVARTRSLPERVRRRNSRSLSQRNMHMVLQWLTDVNCEKGTCQVINRTTLYFNNTLAEHGLYYLVLT